MEPLDQSRPQDADNEAEDVASPIGEESERPESPEAEASDPAASEGENASSEEELDEMRSKVKKAREEAEEYKNQLQRTAAELQNLHRRIGRDMENARALTLRDFVRALVPSIDNLERALQVPSDQGEALRNGVQMVYQEILKTLGNFHIEVVCPDGGPLDPNLHEAVMRQPESGAAENTILQVFEKGYTLKEIVIRPARVIVASGEEPEAPEAPPEDDDETTED